MITKNYIKMCEKNEDLQKLCKYEGGEIFLNVANEFEIMPFNLTEKMKEWYKYYYHIWLPTQEQLQEMILKIFSPFAKIIKLNEFVSNYVKLYKGTKYENKYWVELYPTVIESINEFWLMYVMYEKYKKIWTGKKWAKAE